MFCTGPQVSPKSAEMIWREIVRLSAEMKNIGKPGSCQKKKENLKVLKKKALSSVQVLNSKSLDEGSGICYICVQGNFAIQNIFLASATTICYPKRFKDK